jgi:hypothetical protein
VNTKEKQRKPFFRTTAEKPVVLSSSVKSENYSPSKSRLPHKPHACLPINTTIGPATTSPLHWRDRLKPGRRVTGNNHAQPNQLALSWAGVHSRHLGWAWAHAPLLACLAGRKKRRASCFGGSACDLRGEANLLRPP